MSAVDSFLVGLAFAGLFVFLFTLLICKLITARPVEVVYEEGYRNMDRLRCPLCHRVKVRGTEHGYGRCASSPVPPPPPARLIEATYRKAAR